MVPTACECAGLGVKSEMADSLQGLSPCGRILGKPTAEPVSEGVVAGRLDGKEPPFAAFNGFRAIAPAPFVHDDWL